MGSLQGVRVGDDNGIYGKSHDDSAWVGGIGATELENPSYGGRATDISNGLPGQGRPTELPGGRMPRPSGDEDGNSGPFPAPAWPIHCGHFGGGKPPPPTVPLMQHAGPPVYTKRKAPCHFTVRQGSGAKEAAASGGGAEREHGEGFRGIQGSALKWYGVYVPGTGVDGRR